MPRTTTIILNEKSFDVTALRVKQLKKLAREVVRTIKEFYDFQNMDDEAMAIAAMDALLERPEQFMSQLAPNVPATDIEDAYLDELIDALTACLEIQGFDRFSKLSGPIRNIMAMETGVVSEPEPVMVVESVPDSTTSTPGSSTTTDETPTDSI